MTPKQKRAMRKGQMLMKRATPAMRRKWAAKAAATRASKRSRVTPLAEFNLREGADPMSLWPLTKRRNPEIYGFERGSKQGDKLGNYPSVSLGNSLYGMDLSYFNTNTAELVRVPVSYLETVDRPERHARHTFSSNPPFRSFLSGGSSHGGINAGDTVTIRTPQGKRTLRGRAVMPSSSGGWVINLGGGTPAVADEENIVSIRKKRSNPELIILSNPPKRKGKGKGKGKSKGKRKGKKKGNCPCRIILKNSKGAKLKYKGKRVTLKSLINRLGKLGTGKYLKRSGKGSYKVKMLGYKKKK